MEEQQPDEAQADTPPLKTATPKPESLPEKTILQETADELIEEQRKSITDKIRFTWRSSDEAVLIRIEAAADEACNTLFAEARHEIDLFYSRLRTYEVDPETGTYRVHGGRYVWATDPYTGKFIEDWDQITGQDIEQCIMTLARVEWEATPMVTKLKNRALYAKMVADDVRDETWGKVVQGTIDDRKAKAARASRIDRYHAFFNYTLYAAAEDYLQQLHNFIFRLRDVRNWRVQSQPR
jgi:hypothetical protein